MNAKQIATLLATILFAAAAYAGEKQHHKMEIEVIMDDGDGETHLTLDSNDLGFNIEDMQVGENRSVLLLTKRDARFSSREPRKATVSTSMERPSICRRSASTAWRHTLTSMST